MNSLLTVTEFFTSAIDFVSAKWAELLAICGGTAGIIGFFTFLIKTITPLITAKINSKQRIPQNIESLKNQVEFLKATLDKVEKKLDELPNLVSDTVNKGLATYQKAKQKACESILKGKTKVNEFVENAKTQLKAEIEPIQEIIEKVEEITEKTKETAETIKNDTIKVVIHND